LSHIYGIYEALVVVLDRSSQASDQYTSHTISPIISLHIPHHHYKTPIPKTNHPIKVVMKYLILLVPSEKDTHNITTPLFKRRAFLNKGNGEQGRF
jgi:hypothetical protein